MTDEQLKQLVSNELNTQNLKDLKEILKTEHGRRFFYKLCVDCGKDLTSFTRDSRTYFNEGTRNVALMLEANAKRLGLEGLDLMHKAEREYIIYQDNVTIEIKCKNKG
jgi:hypothetical protein